MFWTEISEFTVPLLLLIFALMVGIILGRKLGFREGYLFFEKRILPKRLDASRASLKGQISEHLVPLIPGFGFKPSECRFIGKPVDFLVFRGLDEGAVKEVVFLEVKTGKSSETAVEKSLRDAVKEKNVSWKLYRVPEDISNG
jgi:predicted Holliday junction resolvase-like endonuclease